MRQQGKVANMLLIAHSAGNHDNLLLRIHLVLMNSAGFLLKSFSFFWVGEVKDSNRMGENSYFIYILGNAMVNVVKPEMLQQGKVANMWLASLYSAGNHDNPGFSLGRLHMGGFVPPPYGGTSAGDKALMRGLMRGDIDLMGGDLTLIDYIIN